MSLDAVFRIQNRRVRKFLDLQDPGADHLLFVRIRIFPSTSKKMDKNLDFNCLVTP
jgi:hypothetical protein